MILKVLPSSDILMLIKYYRVLFNTVIVVSTMLVQYCDVFCMLLIMIQQCTEQLATVIKESVPFT
jgi:hypothetical protein